MGKRKAAAKSLPEPSSRTSVLPSPKLVGSARPSEPPPAEGEAKPAPLTKHEPTLIGLQKQRPTALPPVKASTAAAAQPEPSTPAPAQKRESSLVGLSLKVERAVRHKTGTRLKPPSAPPRSRDSVAGEANSHAANKRHSADPTDYDVHIVGAYDAPPLLPKSHNSETIDLSNSDELWEESPEKAAFRRSKRSTIFTAIALFAVAALGLGVCAYVSKGKAPEASVHAARIEQRPEAELPKAGAAPTPPGVHSVAAPIPNMPQALEDTKLPTEAKAEPASSEKSAVTEAKSSTSKGKKLSARQKARRLRALHRAQKRKARRSSQTGSLDSSVSLR